MSGANLSECGGLTPLLNFAERRGNVKKNDFVVTQSAVKPAHSKVRPRRLTKIQVSMKPVKFAFTDIFMV